MGSFGQSLRAARESRGISLEAVSKTTKIRTEYLVALESDDFERLPDSVFSRGFVRAYAEVVGLDPDTAVAAIAVERKARGTEGAEQVADVLTELNRVILDKASPAAPQPSRRRLVLGGAVIVLLGLVGLASWLTFRPGASPPIALADPHPSPPPAPSEPGHTTAAPETLEEAAVDAPVGPPDPAPASSMSMSVFEFAVGRGVADRRVVNPAESFNEGQTVWFWTRVDGAAAGQRIRHVWLRAGQEVHTMDLQLGGSSWRTQSTKKMWPGSRGNWRVEARDPDGRVLAAIDFVCR